MAGCPGSAERLLFYRYRGAADAHHQHAALGTDGFIVDIDTDNGIGAEIGGLLTQFLEGDGARLFQFFLIGRRATADDIANAGEDVFENIGAENGLTGNDTVITHDLAALD